MKNKVLLAVYGVTITREGNSQIPSDFGNHLDLLQLFHEFAEYVLKNVRKWPRQNKSTLALTGTTVPKLDTEERETYGYFKAGRDGESFTAANLTREEAEYIDYDSDTHIIRDAFFYLNVPNRQRRAYLILQRSQSEGIKDLVRHFFVEFMNLRGLQYYRIQFSNLLNDKVFAHMVNNGKLKEVTVIKNKVPADVLDVHNEGKEVVMVEGSVKAVYQAADLSDNWKEWALETMKNKKFNMVEGDTRAKILLGGREDYVNELSFRVELDKKQKTFHLVRGSRTQPDIDVTDRVEKGPDGRYRIADLVTQSRELVNDVNLKLNEKDDDSEDE